MPSNERLKGRSASDEPTRYRKGAARDSEFVDLELTKDQKAAVREMYDNLDAVDAALQALFSDGTKVTLRWDDRNNCFAAFAFAAEGTQNEGLILTGRGGGVTRALRQLVYKHTVILDGDWGAWKNRPRDEDDDLW